MERLTKRAENGKAYMVESFASLTTGIWLAIDKLAEYEDVEEQGLLLRLPCKVGDTIYLVDFEENDYDEAIIEEIIIGKNGIFINSDYEIGTPLNADYVTLTEEEAEKKLAEMKGE